MESVASLGYADEPDYDYLRELLLKVYVRDGYASDLPFDWEVKENVQKSFVNGSLVDDPMVTSSTVQKDGVKRDDKIDIFGDDKKSLGGDEDGEKKNEDGKNDQKKNGETRCCSIL
jgi:hypothetical protein